MRFEEGSGDTAENETIGQHFRVFNGATFNDTEGVGNGTYAVSFNGVEAQVRNETGFGVGLNAQGEWTLDFYITLKDIATDNQYPLMIGGSSYDRGWEAYCQTQSN